MDKQQIFDEEFNRLLRRFPTHTAKEADEYRQDLWEMLKVYNIALIRQSFVYLRQNHTSRTLPPPKLFKESINNYKPDTLKDKGDNKLICCICSKEYDVDINYSTRYCNEHLEKYYPDEYRALKEKLDNWNCENWRNEIKRITEKMKIENDDLPF